MGPGFDVGIGGGPGIPPRFPGRGGMGRDIRDPGRDRSRLERRKSREMERENRRRERRERMEKDRREFEKRRPRGPGRSKPPERRPIEGRKPPWMDKKPPFFEGPLPGPDRPGINPPKWGINPPRDRPSINPIRSNDPRRERDAFLKKRGIQVWDNAAPGTPVASYSPGFKNESYFASDRAGAAGFSNEQKVKDFMKSMGQKQFPGESPGQDSVQSDFLKGNLDRYTQFLSLLKGFRNRR